MADRDVHHAVTSEEALEFVAVRPEGEGWVGMAPTWFGEYVFGGCVIGQAVLAATRSAPKGRRVHSLHAYFLRPAVSGRPISYRIGSIRDGRTFATRRIEAVQEGAHLLSMMCSFTADTEGYEYELPIARDVPGPEEREVHPGPGPWVAVKLGPTPAEADGTRLSTHRIWFRLPLDLPDDPHLHAALIAFATDWTGTGGRPLQLEGNTGGMVSLDHAVWFHRPVRADQWTLYDVHSLVNAGGRGLLRGTMHSLDRRLAVTVAQEMLLRPVSP